MKRLAVVMVLANALGDSKQPTYHEYRHAGMTRCGRGFYITATDWELGEERMEFVSRRHAEKFARPCKRCQAAT